MSSNANRIDILFGVDTKASAKQITDDIAKLAKDFSSEGKGKAIPIPVEFEGVEDIASTIEKKLKDTKINVKLGDLLEIKDGTIKLDVDNKVFNTLESVMRDLNGSIRQLNATLSQGVSINGFQGGATAAPPSSPTPPSSPSGGSSGKSLVPDVPVAKKGKVKADIKTEQGIIDSYVSKLKNSNAVTEQAIKNTAKYTDRKNKELQRLNDFLNNADSDFSNPVGTLLPQGKYKGYGRKGLTNVHSANMGSKENLVLSHTGVSSDVAQLDLAIEKIMQGRTEHLTDDFRNTISKIMGKPTTISSANVAELKKKRQELANQMSAYTSKMWDETVKIMTDQLIEEEYLAQAKEAAKDEIAALKQSPSAKSKGSKSPQKLKRYSDALKALSAVEEQKEYATADDIAKARKKSQNAYNAMYQILSGEDKNNKITSLDQLKALDPTTYTKVAASTDFTGELDSAVKGFIKANEALHNGILSTLDNAEKALGSAGNAISGQVSGGSSGKKALDKAAALESAKTAAPLLQQLAKGYHVTETDDTKLQGLKESVLSNAKEQYATIQKGISTASLAALKQFNSNVYKMADAEKSGKNLTVKEARAYFEKYYNGLLKKATDNINEAFKQATPKAQPKPSGVTQSAYDLVGRINAIDNMGVTNLSDARYDYQSQKNAILSATSKSDLEKYARHLLPSNTDISGMDTTALRDLLLNAVQKRYDNIVEHVKAISNIGSEVDDIYSSMVAFAQNANDEDIKAFASAKFGANVLNITESGARTGSKQSQREIEQTALNMTRSQIVSQIGRFAERASQKSLTAASELARLDTAISQEIAVDPTPIAEAVNEVSENAIESAASSIKAQAASTSRGPQLEGEAKELYDRVQALRQNYGTELGIGKFNTTRYIREADESGHSFKTTGVTLGLNDIEKSIIGKTYNEQTIKSLERIEEAVVQVDKAANAALYDVNTNMVAMIDNGDDVETMLRKVAKAWYNKEFEQLTKGQAEGVRRAVDETISGYDKIANAQQRYKNRLNPDFGLSYIPELPDGSTGLSKGDTSKVVPMTNKSYLVESTSEAIRQYDDLNTRMEKTQANIDRYNKKLADQVDIKNRIASLEKEISATRSKGGDTAELESQKVILENQLKTPKAIKNVETRLANAKNKMTELKNEAQLLQNNVEETFTDQAKDLDLVNGKYEEQRKLLLEIDDILEAVESQPQNAHNLNTDARSIPKGKVNALNDLARQRFALPFYDPRGEAEGTISSSAREQIESDVENAVTLINREIVSKGFGQTINGQSVGGIFFSDDDVQASKRLREAVVGLVSGMMSLEQATAHVHAEYAAMYTEAQKALSAQKDYEAEQLTTDSHATEPATRIPAAEQRLLLPQRTSASTDKSSTPPPAPEPPKPPEDTLLTRLEKLRQKYEHLITTYAKYGQAYDNLEKKIKKGKAEKSDVDQFESKLKDASIKKVPYEEVETAIQKLETYHARLQQLRTEMVARGSPDDDVKQITGVIEGLGNSIDEYKGKLKSVSKGSKVDFNLEEWEKFKFTTTDTGKKLTALTQHFQVFKKEAKVRLGIDDATKQLEKFESSHKRLIKSNPVLANSVDVLKKRLADLGKSANVSDADLAEVRRMLDALNVEAKNSIGIFAKLRERFKSSLGERILFMSSGALVRAIPQTFRKIVDAVKETDLAMTELKKVTDETAVSYDLFLDRAGQKAQSIGASVADYVNSVADFARLGYTLNESESLAETATIYKNVGDGIENIGEASESVISTMKAFGIEASNSMSIIDAFNEVGNNFAISSSGIGTAMLNSASALNTANNSFAESVGLITAANAVVQDPSKVGTALKTITMYLRAAKTDAEAAGESADGMATSVSKLREELLALTGNKVDIMIDDQTFKSTYDILKDLSKVWGDLSDVTQANIIEKIGGKRNANVIAGILTNFDDAEAAIQAISRSSGSAQREQEKWLDSIEGRTYQLQAAFQSLSVSVLNSDTVAGAYELLTKLVNGLELIAQHGAAAKGVLGALAITLTTLNFSKIGESIYTTSNNLKGLWATFRDFAAAGANGVKGISGFKNLFSGFGKYTESLEDVKKATRLVEEAQADLILAEKTGGIESKEYGAAQDLLKLRQEGLTTATNKLKVAQLGLTNVLSAVMLAVTAASIGYSIYKKHQQEAAQQAEEAAEAYKDSKQSLEDYAKRFRELREEMANTTDEDTIIQKKRDLAEIEQDLIDKFGSEASGLRLVTGEIEDQAKAIENLGKQDFIDYLAKNDKKIQEASAYYKHWVIGNAKGDAGTYEEVSNWLRENGFAGTLSIGVTGFDIVDIAGQGEELYRAMQKMAEYANSEQSKFSDKTKAFINQAYTDAKAAHDEYMDYINQRGEGYFVYQASDENAESYAGLLKSIDNFKKAQDAGDVVAQEAAKSSAETYKETLLNNVDNEVAGQYIRSMFDQVFTVDATVDIRLHASVINNDNGIQDAINHYTKNGIFDESQFRSDFDNRDVPTPAGYSYRNNIQPFIELMNDENIDTIDELIEKLEEINAIKLNDVTSEAENFVSAFDKMADAMEDTDKGLAKLDNVYNNLKDGKINQVWKDVYSKDFREAFKGLGDSYEEFIKAIANNPDDIRGAQTAFNNLMQDYLKSSDIYKNLTADNADLAKAYLKSRGVKNADAVVTSMLSHKIEDLGIVTADTAQNLLDCATAAQKSAAADKAVAMASGDTTGSLADQAAQLGLTEQAYVDLLYAEIAFSNNKLDVSQKITALQNLLTMLNLVGSVYSSEFGGMVEVTYADALKYGYITEEEYNELPAAGVGIDESITTHIPLSKILEKNKSNDDDIEKPEYNPPDTTTGGGGSGGDKYLQAWKQQVKEKKALVEADKMTEEDYYKWLEDHYKAKGGPGWPGAKNYKEYGDEIAEIEADIYNHKKQALQDSVDEQKAILDKQKAEGKIDEVKYNKEMEKIYQDGYNELERMINEEGLYGVDTKERLDAENKMLDSLRQAHIDSYKAEVDELDRLRDMELITEEMYYAKRAELMMEYYGKEEMYREELKEEEEALTKTRNDLIKKWSGVAKSAIESVTNTAKDLADVLENLTTGLIDANRDNFDLQQSVLEHALNMNYITQAEYTRALDQLYKTYFMNKATYFDEYMQYELEVYQQEQEMLENGAGAIEDLHAKVVDMIKKELEDTKKKIEETKDEYMRLVEVREKALERQKDDDDYEKDRAEKINDIAELRRQLNALASDTSAEGRRKYKEIQSQLIKAERDLKEFAEDHAYDMGKQQIADEKEAFTQQAEDQTKAIDKKLQDNEWLREEAWRLVNEGGDALYQALLEFARKNSTAIKDEVTPVWKELDEWVKKVGDDMNGITLEQYYGQDAREGMQRRITFKEEYTPYTDEEFMMDEAIVTQKSIENYLEVGSEFAEGMAGVIGDAVQSYAQILDDIFGNTFTAVLVDAAGMFAGGLTGIAGLGSSMLAIQTALGGATGIVSMMSGLVGLANGGGGGLAIGGIGVTKMLASLGSISGGVGNIMGVGAGLPAILSMLAQNGAGLSMISTGLTGFATAFSGIGSMIAGLFDGSAPSFGIFNAFHQLIHNIATFGTGGEIGISSGISFLANIIQQIFSFCSGWWNEWSNFTFDFTTVTNVLSAIWDMISRILNYVGTISINGETITNVVTGVKTAVVEAGRYLSNMFGGGFASGTNNVPRTGFYRTDELGTELKMLRGKSGTYTMLTKGSKVLNSDMTRRIVEIAQNPGKAFGGVMGDVKTADIPVVPVSNVNNNQNVTVSPVFQIQSSDPEGVAAEIKKLLPEIAAYTTGNMVGSMHNKGVKRTVNKLL